MPVFHHFLLLKNNVGNKPKKIRMLFLKNTGAFWKKYGSFFLKTPMFFQAMVSTYFSATYNLDFSS